MKAYRILGYAIAVEVVLQAAFIVFAVFGEGHWIEEDGGVLNKAVFDAKDHPDFTGAIGFGLHPLNGTLVIPLIALALVVTSFFIKAAGFTKQALIVLGLVALQITLGLAAHSIVWLGPLHAINAFLILWAGLSAARLAGGSFFVHSKSDDVAV